jgi:hypothetical protein
VKVVGRIDPDPAIAFNHFQMFQNLQKPPPPTQSPQTTMLQHLHERFGGAIQYRYLDGIDVDKDVVDAAGINRCEQMLGSREQNALFHQTGGVTHPCNIVPLGLDGEIVEINAAKNDPGFGWRR